METARLRLQSPTQRDRAIMAATASDPEAQRWLGWVSAGIVPERDRERVLAMRPGKGDMTRPSHWMNLIAIDKDSGLAAGGASVQLTVTIEVGAHLAPRFRGHGLGTELFAGIAEFAHQHLGLPIVVAGAEPDNAPSRRALLAAGFTPIPGPDTHIQPDGRAIPSVWLKHESAETRLCAAGKVTVRWARKAVALRRS